MSSSSEGLARAYLEAQACGKLLLASNIPAAREVITDGETGLLFRTGHIDDLTTKTLVSIGAPELCARIGRQARRRVEANALETAVDRYVEALGSLARAYRG